MTLRHLSVLVLRSLWLGSLLFAAGCEGEVTREGPPNVILIFTDDQGTLDAGVYGASDLLTPNIDRMAAEGVRFTQFYAGAPVCSPSRAALLTGRYPARAGVPGNIPFRPGLEGGMPAEEVTIAEMRKAHGYATGHIGKWHLGHHETTQPNGQGFDYSFGHHGGCIDNYSHFFYWSGPNIHDLWRNGEEIYCDGGYFPDLMHEEVTTFIDRHADQPFFVYYAINAPHYPYQGDEEWVKYYQDQGVPYPRDLYNAFVTSMDARIGMLMDHLEAKGLKDDTILIFQSDHGHSNEERAHFGGGYAGPYRGAKFSMFEGGLRVPAIISWPGHLPQGVVRDQLTHSTDWFPTIAALTGARLPDAFLDGHNLTDVLQNDAPTTRIETVWHLGRQGRHRWAVRKGSWKLLKNPQDTSNKAPLTEADTLFLVNLDDDIGEMTNLAPQRPDMVAELTAVFEATRASY